MSESQKPKALLDFSLGRITEHEVFVALGIDRQEDLFLLMAKARLPMPRLAVSLKQSMVDSLRTLLP